MGHLSFNRQRASLALVLALCAAPALADEAKRLVDINEYLVLGNTVLAPADIEEAVYPFLGPQRTMDDIESAREALQKRYQALGYQSVYVELPEQQVEGGIVQLKVSETRVGQVKVVGAKHYSPRELREEVPALKEGSVPDFDKVQEQLATANRNPGRQVVPLVREGSRPGTMDVDLKVEDKNPWRLSAGLNNDYSADTEELRSMLSIGHDNLWQAGHSASISYYTAPQDRENTEVWSANYSAPLSERWAVQLSALKSDSNVASVGGTNVLGKGHSYGLSMVYTVPMKGPWSHSLSAGIDLKSFDEVLQFGESTDTAPIRYAPFTLGYNGYRFTDQSQLALGLSLVAGTRGLFGYDSDEQEFRYKRWGAKPGFAAVRGDTSYTFDVIGNWQSASKVAFQLASGPLISNEQFTAGGATSVRGYLAAERSGDDGWVVSQELRTPSLGKYLGKTLGSHIDDWRLYVFAEGGHLSLQDTPEEQEDEFSLASVGLGTRLTLSQWLSGSLDWGYPLKDGPNTEKHDSRVHFSVQANF